MKTCSKCLLSLKDCEFSGRRKVCKKCFNLSNKKECPDCKNLINKTTKNCRFCYAKKLANQKEKQCLECKQTFDISEFRTTKNGYYSSYCNKCSITRANEYKKRNPEKAKNWKDSWYKNNQDKVKLSWIKVKIKKDCHDIPEDKITEKAIEISKKQFCDCCGKKFKGKYNKQIDHCHDSMKYRGVLCSNCNSTLGHCHDSIEQLKLCIGYLEKFNG